MNGLLTLKFNDEYLNVKINNLSWNIQLRSSSLMLNLIGAENLISACCS